MRSVYTANSRTFPSLHKSKSLGSTNRRRQANPKDIPAELLSLPDLMKDEEFQCLADSLLERWGQLQREYFDSPGWNLLRGGDDYYYGDLEYPDPTAMWVIRTRPHRSDWDDDEDDEDDEEEEEVVEEGDSRQTPWVVFYAGTKRETPATELEEKKHTRGQRPRIFELKGMSYEGLGFKIDGAGNVAYDWEKE